MKKIPYWFIRLLRPVVVVLTVAIGVWMLRWLIRYVAYLPDVRGKLVVDLVHGLAWPVVVLLALTAFARPLGAFLTTVGSRITRLTVFDIGIEVAELREFQPAWVSMDMDFRRVSPPYIFDSYSHTLFTQLAETTAADFVVVDLAKGSQWLTSRLFLFAIMLQRFRKVRAFVFLETRGEIPGVYLGAAFTDQVRWALAQQYPWLEAAYARAYADVLLPPGNQWPGSDLGFTPTGAMDRDRARHIAEKFLSNIQSPTPPPPDEKRQWDSLGNPPTVWERAEWITGNLLRGLMKDDLQEGHTTLSVLQTPEEQIPLIAEHDSQLVGITRSDGRFQSLVDRTALLEEVAVRTVAQQRRRGS